MKIIPMHLDYMIDTLELIQDDIISRIQHNLETIKREQRLCCDNGLYLVKEFGFTGDVKSVIKQAEAYITELETNGLTEAQRSPLNLCKTYAIDCLSERATETSFKDDFKAAMKDGNHKSMNDVIDRKSNHFDSMHNARECLCYING